MSVSSVGPVSSLTLRHFVEQLLVIFQWPLCRLGRWQVCSAECEGRGSCEGLVLPACVVVCAFAWHCHRCSSFASVGQRNEQREPHRQAARVSTLSLATTTLYRASGAVRVPGASCSGQVHPASALQTATTRRRAEEDSGNALLAFERSN